MKARLRTIGRSTALVIPEPMLSALAIGPGDEIDLDLQDRSIVLTPRDHHPPQRAEASKAMVDAREGLVSETLESEWKWLDDIVGKLDDDFFEIMREAREEQSRLALNQPFSATDLKARR